MNKDNLQKELKEKIKAGIKPSDLKKKKPIIVSKSEEDEGYESEEATNRYESPLKNHGETTTKNDIPTPPPLPNQQVKTLQEQIKALNRQVKVYQDFKEADLKIKEKLKGEIKNLNNNLTWAKTEIEERKEKVIELVRENKELKEKVQRLYGEEAKNQIKETNETKTFFCDNCQLTKTGTLTKRKADCPFEPRLHGRIVYLCSSCSPYVKELSEPNYDPDNNPYKY